MELDVRTEQSGATCTMVLTGEVDVYTSPRLKQEFGDLLDGGCADIVVDLDGLGFIDSSGLGVLVSALRRAKDHGGTVRLVCTNEAILKIFRITGLDKVFPLFKTVDEARGF